MQLEQAIKEAIAFEIKVRDAYRQARDLAKSAARFRILKGLAEEEEMHVDFLQGQLALWQRTGKVDSAQLKTALPDSGKLTAGIDKIEKKLAAKEFDDERKLLQVAFDCETETYKFYEKLVGEDLEGEGAKELFSRFLAIEEGHLILVKAELDYAISDQANWLKFE